MALVTGTAVMVPASAQASHTQASLEECSGPAAAADAAAAVRAAVECGRDVEVLGERTEHNTVFAQADGTMRLDVSALAVRTRQGGRWVEVDNTVVRGAHGFEVTAAVTPMTFSDGSGDLPLATIERDGHILEFDVPFELPAPEVDGSRLTYRDVIPDVDLVITVAQDATGFTEVLRVATPAAAADPRLAELVFPIEVTDGLEVAPRDGGFVATDHAGETVFTSTTPTMWDSRDVAEEASSAFSDGERRAVPPMADAARPAMTAAERRAHRAVAPVGGETVRAMPARVDGDAVRITPDRAMLQSPATVWPVYIDPPISGSRVEWTAVRDGYSQAYMFDPDQGVGLCVAGPCAKTFRSRLLWKFAGLETVGGLHPDHVLSTTFSAVGTHSYDCTARPVTLHRVDNWNSATPWPGGPTWVPQSTQSVAHKSTCSGQPVRWIEFPAHEAGRAVALYDSNQLTLGLAVDESTMAYWKRYRNDAVLSITYNRPPNLPADVRFTDPAVPCVMGAGRPFIRTATPTIHAVHSDPDGDNVQANVDVYFASMPSGSENILWHGRPAAQGSGAGQLVTVGGMAHGSIYRVQMNSVDTYGWGGYGVACEVEVDTEPPAAATVTAVASGTQPVYGPTGSAGGVGKTGSFTFGNGGSTDVTEYRYSFNSTSLANATPAGSPTITFTPTSPGTQTLTYQSIDRAGWTSPAKTYVFSVAFPGKVTWKLDETSGTTAAGIGANGANVLPLTVSASLGTRVGGRLATLGVDQADKALDFNGADDTARSTTAAVSTTGSFSVAAVVRSNVASGTATAVSQDGAATAGFELGYRPCANGVGSCWAFSMNPTDSTSAVPTAVVSTVAVQANAWVEVTGVHNTDANTLQLWVCTVRNGTDAFGDPTLISTLSASGTQSFGATWQAKGALQLGRAKAGSAAMWSGAVGNVRVADGVLTETDVRRTCDAPA